MKSILIQYSSYVLQTSSKIMLLSYFINKLLHLDVAIYVEVSCLIQNQFDKLMILDHLIIIKIQLNGIDYKNHTLIFPQISYFS